MKLNRRPELELHAFATVVCMAVAMFTTTACTARADVTLVRNGQAKASIYVDEPWQLEEKLDLKARYRLRKDKAKQYEHRHMRHVMVEDLNLHIKRITGAELPVVLVKHADEIKGPGIVIGKPAVDLGAVAKHDTTMKESLRVMTKGDLILIGGEGERSYRHGVYELLRQIGCDWLMPGDEGIVSPTAKTLVVAEMDIARKPAFEVRAPWYSGGPRIIEWDEFESFERWKIRQQQTPRPDVHDHPDFMWGGHMWASLIAHNKKELDANPELYAQVRQPDGTLGPGKAQLDPTQPRILEMSVDYIRKVFERWGWPKDKLMSFSVGPNDGGGYSLSPAALARGVGRFDPITGGRDQTDVLIWYVNTLQEMVKDEFPNLKLGWLIYSVHGDFPMVVKPNPRFIAHFADITQSRYHSLLDQRSPTRVYYKRVVDRWAQLHKEQGNPLWYYGYNWNLAENMLPYSKMKIWGQDLPYYHKKGFLGHNNESDKAWSILAPHNYLMARMGWDIDLDWQQVLKDYCAKAFGKGGPAMEQYYLMLIEQQETAGSEAGGYGTCHLIFTDDFIVKLQHQLDKAAAVADTAYHKKMVDYFSQPLQAAKIYIAFRKALLRYDYAEAVKQYDAMVKQWDATLAKNPELASRYARRYIDWLFKPVAQNGLKYSTGEYRISYRIPDELPMAIDPKAAGAELGLQLPDVDDDQWIKIKTYSSSFSEQGFQFVGKTALWFRTEFEGPAVNTTTDGKGVGLFVGAVEDEVRVFVNGKYIGKGRGFVRPFTFDLTEHIKPGETNLLALQVIRNSYLNENGRGGIIYPCFVFTGPRLEKVAPNNEPLIRILPGGATEQITE